eukprot:1114255-Pleurochrysis_carterae.AAC.1
MPHALQLCEPSQRLARQGNSHRMHSDGSVHVQERRQGARGRAGAWTRVCYCARSMCALRALCARVLSSPV